MSARPWAPMTSRSSGEPLIWLSAPPRRPPVLLGGLWQPWWQRRCISGWPCLTLKIKTGSSYWTPRLRLWVCSATPSSPSSTDTGRLVDKRGRSSGSCLVALQLKWLLDGSSPIRMPAPRTGRHRDRASPLVLLRVGTEVASGTLRRGLLSWRRTCGPCFRPRRLWRSPDAHGPGLMRVAPAGGELFSPRFPVPVPRQCPQEVGLPTLVTGHSDLQRAYISVSSAWKCGTEMLATPSGVSRTASSAVPCRCAIPGRRTSCSDYTRGQSRETGSLSKPFGSMETTAKCVTMGPADCRERLQNPVRFSTASIQRGYSHSGGPRAGSGNGTRSRHSLEEGGHRGGPSPRKGVWVLQPVLHSPKEGWGVASDFRSASAEPLSHATEVQDADTQTGRVSDQVQGLVCHDRSKGHILPFLHPSHSQEVSDVCFRGWSLPISGSSVWPSTRAARFWINWESRFFFSNRDHDSPTILN